MPFPALFFRGGKGGYSKGITQLATHLKIRLSKKLKVIWDSGARVARDFFKKKRIISFQPRNDFRVIGAQAEKTPAGKLRQGL